MYTVVIADDEEEIRKSLIRKIDWESIGFQVVGEAANGEDALELVEKTDPDLLLTDVKMPFISGIELARQVREIKPSLQIAFLSGYDDFTYAQQAIQYNIISYMLKPISSEELTKELIHIREKIEKKFKEFASVSSDIEKMAKSDFLMPLLLDGFQINKEEILSDAVASGVLQDKNTDDLKYVVIVTKIIDGDGKNRTIRGTASAVDSILKKYVKYASVYVHGRVASLLMATEFSMSKYLPILVEDITQSVKRIMGQTCLIGVSRTAADFSGVHECYLEAVNAIGYSSIENGTIQFIADVEKKDTLDLEIVQKIIAEVENMIRSGTKEEISAYLLEFKDVIEREGISKIDMNYILFQASAFIYQTVYAVAGSEALLRLQNEFSFYSMPVYGDTKNALIYFENICQEARKLISEQRKKSSEIICDDTIKIIEEQYMDSNLSLSEVSRQIGVSPNYLSAVIKKENGSTFKDLLTKKRIEKAEELLLCSSLKIREITERCGYNDQHYFSYCFKKYTGMSPNTCRRNHEEEKE